MVGTWRDLYTHCSFNVLLIGSPHSTGLRKLKKHPRTVHMECYSSQENLSINEKDLTSAKGKKRKPKIIITWP